MSNDLRIAILLVALVLYLVIFIALRSNRIPLKFALVWLLPTTVVFLIGVVPEFLIWITKLIGFQTTSNLIIGILFVILIFICIALTIIVSGQNTKIILLVQELSILKSKINKNEEESDQINMD